MVELKARPFGQASAHALGDSQLQESLRKVGGGFDAARLEAIDELGPERWEELRLRAREIKQNAIENLDYWLEMVYDRVTANGGHVHFATDGKEANDIVTGLARSKGVKLATKSKSMVSEETGLNGALEQAGVEVVETDLGEYIIQLAEETPFHIIAPAMHKTRRQVSSLFEENGVASGLTDIEDMARAAREALRGKLLTADMGITGANFLVAETGTVVIVTNEGQRPLLHLSAPHPRSPDRYGKGGAVIGRLACVPPPAAQSGHRPATHQLREHDFPAPVEATTRTGRTSSTWSSSTTGAHACSRTLT